ncbi:MAG: transposase [Candidatus Thermoplasmatota archaeon]
MVMEQVVTAKVKVTGESIALDETLNKYREAVKYSIDSAWEKGLKSHNSIREDSYYDIREKYDLQAQLATNATKHASEMVKEADGKPEVKREAIRYNFPRSASVSGEWNELSLATVEGRKKFDINIPECYEKYLDWDVCESTLIKKKGDFYFCFVFAKEVNIDLSCCDDLKVLGVDFGVNKVAVTSDGNFYGTEVKKKRKERDGFVAEVQSKGTHEAHKRLEEYGSRWKRFMDWKNHNISREIIDNFSEGDVIVMEDLTYVRENAKYNEWVHKWAFRDLREKIEYKATLKGIRVVYTDPKNTSKTCSCCGSLDTYRRVAWFECNNCSHTLDADLNASRYIAQRYMRNMGLRVACNPAHDSRDDEADNPYNRSEAENTRKPLPKFQFREGLIT